MEAKEILKELRQKHDMTQGQLAEKLAVTRQAVSRWENGESVPNPETLKQLSALFDTSAGIWTAASTRTTANGATQAENSPMPAWMRCWNFLSVICPVSNSLLNKPEPTSARCCQS